MDKKDASNDRIGETNCFRCGISGNLANNKICKINYEINSFDINFLVDNGAGANIIDIDTLQKIWKVCGIGLETTNSKIYTFGSTH